MQRNKRVIHYCGEGFKTQANGSFLMGTFLIVSKKWTVNQVKEAFGNRYLNSLRPFRDAGVGPDDFPLTVVDCLKSVERAVELKWYSKTGFNSREFEDMLKPSDLSWIVPDEIIAFSSPVDPAYARGGRSSHSVRSEDLISPFQDLNVKGIIRLNDKLYDAG